MPRDVVETMKRVGIYRATRPAMFGGKPMAPPDFVRIAVVDGSAAWVAAFGAANTYMTSLPVETQRVINVNGPDQVFAGGLYPAQKARAVPGGCEVTGRWRFASGCMGADWIGVGIQQWTDPFGRPMLRFADPDDEDRAAGMPEDGFLAEAVPLAP